MAVLKTVIQQTATTTKRQLKIGCGGATVGNGGTGTSPRLKLFLRQIGQSQSVLSFIQVFQQWG